MWLLHSLNDPIVQAYKMFTVHMVSTNSPMVSSVSLIGRTRKKYSIPSMYGTFTAVSTIYMLRVIMTSSTLTIFTVSLMED